MESNSSILPTSSDSPAFAAFSNVPDSQPTRPNVYAPPAFTAGISRGSSEGGEEDLEFGQEDDEQRVTPDLVRIAVVAGIGGLLFGFDTGVVSGALLSLSQDPSPLDPLSTSQESFLVTSALIGAFLTSLFAGRLADSERLGRKGVIIISAILFLIGAAEMAAAQVYKEIILGRVLVGFGVGLASCVLPTYLAELSPPKFRGRIVASLVVLITGGQVLAYLIDALALHLTSSQPWRWMFGFGIIPAALQLVLSFSLPESPRHLFRNGKTARGRQVIRRLNPNWTPDRIQREVDMLMTESGGSVEPERLRIEGEDEEKWYSRCAKRLAGLRRMDWKEKSLVWEKERARYMELVWDDRANRRTLLVACGLQFFQQVTGFNCLMYYSTKVIQQTHLSSPATFALLIAISNFVCTLIALRLIDHTGRRRLLLGGLIGMISGMLVLSISFGFIREGQERAGVAAVLSLIGMTGFCCAYALSLGNVPWIVQSEVFVPELKALGTGLATSVNWAGNIFVSSTFLHISRGIGPSGAFALFAAICAGGWGFTYCLLPETKGLSLEEVRSLFKTEDQTPTPPRSEQVGNSYHVLENADDEEQGDSGGEHDSDGDEPRTRRKGVL
ncbi:uncharacterized protein JCM6883_001555 [Sporobolomyces salmoneus]|uniref:uncharacterized protein n=1 Tax=Sporobolomyces salmoneus TaxID=183962 RepID=UPI003173BA09